MPVPSTCVQLPHSGPVLKVEHCIPGPVGVWDPVSHITHQGLQVFREIRILRDASIPLLPASRDGGKNALRPRLTTGSGTTVPSLCVVGCEYVVLREVDPRRRIMVSYVPVDLVGLRIARKREDFTTPHVHHRENQGETYFRHLFSNFTRARAHDSCGCGWGWLPGESTRLRAFNNADS